MIDAEDPKAILSDDTIVKVLKDEALILRAARSQISRGHENRLFRPTAAGKKRKDVTGCVSIRTLRASVRLSFKKHHFLLRFSQYCPVFFIDFIGFFPIS